MAYHTSGSIKKASAAAEVWGSNPITRSTFTVIELWEQVAGYCSKNSRPMTLAAYAYDSISFLRISSNLKATMVEVSNSQMELFHPSIPTLQNG